MSKIWFLAFCICLTIGGTKVFAAAEDELGGTVTATVDGQRIYFPALKTEIDANIQGGVATVRVIQTFDNPTDRPLQATYLFPMNKDSAVYAMTMEVGDEIIQAEIQKKEEAEQTFQKAKSEGKAAALLTQFRPNMFTQKIANLMPGLPVKVTLDYVQTVPKVDDAYELVVPLVVGPRYQPLGAGLPPAELGPELAAAQDVRSDTTFGQWEVEQLPAYPDVTGLTLPKTIEKERVSIRVALNAGVDIERAVSATHAINVKGGDTAKTVSLGKGEVLDNADFVLRYTLAGEDTKAGLLTHRDERGGFFNFMIEPPVLPKTEDVTPREIVFVLDTSGSMSGEPVAASKLFMKHALKNLRKTDYFRIIRFGNNATEFTSGPVPASLANLRVGQSYVDSLRAGGGTEIPSAIRQAFAIREAPGTMRIVVFLTDGYIGNESEVLEMIADEINNSRIYALGVGTSVNRYLLDEMGRMGRGFARYIDPTENTEDVAIELAAKIETPVLTDIDVDWGTLDVSGVTPFQIPDLFAGGSIRLQGQFDGSGTHTVFVNGLVNGAKASLPVEIKLPNKNSGESSEAIPLIWARAQIGEHMRLINTPDYLRHTNLDDTELKEKVTQIGLDYSLSTRWTSFVAVSKKVVNQKPEDSIDAEVPLAMVKGVGPEAYGLQGTYVAQNFAGGATPEPEVWAILVVLMFASLFALRRRRTA